MADSAVAVTAGSGTNIDTRTEGTNGNHRQVVVLGDPATNSGVAPVDATNGLAVDVKASALPSGAATASNQSTANSALSAIQTAVEILDNAISGSEMQVDIVSGTVTANLSATDNAVLDNIDSNTTLPSGIVAGAKTVTTAGTAERLLASTTACKKIIMTAEDDNTGKIFYGGSSVSSSVGDYLFPAQKITIEIDDVYEVYIDAEQDGDGVKFTYFT